MIEFILVFTIWYLVGLIGGGLFLLASKEDITAKTILRTLGLGLFGVGTLIVYFVSGSDVTILKRKD